MRDSAQYLDIDDWSSDAMGEIDHRLVKAPYVRLSAFKKGIRSDAVYVFDLRVTQPGQNFMTTELIHSMEHFLLYGFREHLPHSFVSVAPMGCQTGFYLVTLNESGKETICNAYKNALEYILRASSVPYANPRDCGQSVHHSLAQCQNIAWYLLDNQAGWLDVFEQAA
ncbi:MAG: S-ribosylhomocysteine lyase [Alphaproteobacteria bacterium]|nr:MAG: S-ribosylhomocysteine lyase [Alphaproteobacteria bacterium]